MGWYRWSYRGQKGFLGVGLEYPIYFSTICSVFIGRVPATSTASAVTFLWLVSQGSSRCRLLVTPTAKQLGGALRRTPLCKRDQ